jgi:hypothetical protein
MKSLALLENQKVVEIKTLSGRSFFKVKGTYHEEYIILWPGLVCQCESFIQSLGKPDMFLVRPNQCKHLLSVHLGKALDCILTLMIPDIAFGELVKISTSNK